MPIWNIPFARNLFFTGREDFLERLHVQLRTTKAAAVSQPLAISGLGGIGKTQLAVEYAYRYRHEYKAVLWGRAHTTEALEASYTELARLLQLTQPNEQKQEVIVQAVKKWLSMRQDWLLILDNADELALVRPFLPTTFVGHLLLTTRSLVIGKLAQCLEIDVMNREVGALLLLRRARLVAQNGLLDTASPTDKTLAYRITEELGGLPLALDQAGAYVEETQCGLINYWQLYQTRRKELLKARGGFGDDHPEPVATTWSLSFEQVEQRNPASTALLCLCAFLSPDHIPEELIRDGAYYWKLPLQQATSDLFVFNQVLANLLKFSLVERLAKTRMISIHRLVQTMIRDTMEEEEQITWISRLVCAMSTLFPTAHFDTWEQCARYLPHVVRCGEWIEQKNLLLPEGASLLNRAGLYLEGKAQYEKAEALYQRALAIREQVLGSTHPHTGNILNNLALLYQKQEKYSEAEHLHLRVLAIYEQQPEDAHLKMGQTLNNLAVLYQKQKRYSEAERLHQRALAIYGQLEDTHLEIRDTLNNLAVLYQSQEEYSEAERLLKQALTISERKLGKVHPDTGNILNNLAVLYLKQERYNEAKPLLQRALAISEHQLGTEHPNTQSMQENYAIFSALVDQDENMK